MISKKVRAAIAAAALGTVATVAMGQSPLLAQEAKPAAQAPAGQADDNPVVARVNGKEIRRTEVLAALQQLPPQVQQLPLPMVYPAVLEQVVNAHLVTQAGFKDKLQDTTEVKQRLKAAEERFVQEAFLKKAIDAKMSDALVKKKFDEWLKENPPQDEVRARHILVQTKEEAEALIKQIKGGADFNKLAADQKIDTAAAQQQGDLGYFTKDQMVEPFAKAAFAMKPGDVSQTPVETQFGWHVIKVEDKRKQTPPTYEEAAPELRQVVAQDIAGDVVEGLRKQAKVEMFGIDGGPMPPPPAPPAGNGAAKPAGKDGK
ncbi:peptidylprolyl isomerase [Rhodospirillum centenum]|uniref:Parvulin-like PPIase n=1 Tax=Rhodospirillum centenum (strain ATCC 51521 / SW) TaxID=414684 RepID=B6IUV9_RHOCS|nr:peptidylprolyl isomerase [Rhodospirillum centenum]ACJ00041.1 peptidyl-prolyl cis-trans isomerase family protein, putative [Rhodospirillum centenum SW]